MGQSYMYCMAKARSEHTTLCWQGTSQVTTGDVLGEVGATS